MLRGVTTFSTTFLGTFFFLGFATTVFFFAGFFLGAGFLVLALVLSLLAVLAVFFFVAVVVFVGFFLPAAAVGFFVVFFFATGNARGAVREKKRGRLATTRAGRVAEHGDKVGSRPTRFVSVLSAGRRARAWRTNRENIVEGATALGWKKPKPRCDFDEGTNSGTNTRIILFIAT